MTYHGEIHIHSLPGYDWYHEDPPCRDRTTKWARGYATPFELGRTLAKNGQVIRWLELEDGDLTRLVSVTPRPDSLDRKHWDKYSNNMWEAFEEAGGRLEIHYTPAAEHFEEPKPKAYVLDLLECLPVMDFDTQDGIPLYLLPIDVDERERIHRDHCEYWRIACLEFSSFIEFECYRQLADPHSPTNERGLERRDLLEKALGALVYYKLYCFYGYPQDKDGRPCPICGDMTTSIWKSDCHQCDSCRLLIEISPDNDGEYRAAIGRYRPHRTFTFGKKR